VRAVVRETGTTTNDALFIVRPADGRIVFGSLVEQGFVRSAP